MIRLSSYLFHEGSGLPIGGAEAGGLFLSPPIKGTGDGYAYRREVMGLILAYFSLTRGANLGYNPITGRRVSPSPFDRDRIKKTHFNL